MSRTYSFIDLKSL
uniref:NADH dehydrogenase subunit 3 n=1 Tax=Alocasia macrorrhizos TaxID=4456 RepID=A0A0U2CJL0_ALOMA|nr:NADH dehydrogenase subunit 3 [Alocasia macrorrhizos]